MYVHISLIMSSTLTKLIKIVPTKILPKRPSSLKLEIIYIRPDNLECFAALLHSRESMTEVFITGCFCKKNLQGSLNEKECFLSNL